MNITLLPICITHIFSIADACNCNAYHIYWMLTIDHGCRRQSPNYVAICLGNNNDSDDYSDDDVVSIAVIVIQRQRTTQFQ